MAVRNARAGPKGSPTLRAPWELRLAAVAACARPAWGGGGAGACLSAAKGAERRNPTTARSLIARGGGQALSGDVAGRGQAKDERGFQTARASR